MVYLLYDIVLFLAAFILAPLGLVKGTRYPKLWQGFGERFAIYEKERLHFLKNRQVIWIHAVSIGETKASIPLIKQLRQAFPEAAIVLSSLTFTGRVTAEEIDEADLCLFMPYDFSWIVDRALRQVQPDMVLLVETEIWPNFIRKVSATGIKLVMINGRISDRSFPKYWMVKSLLTPVLQKFTRLCMQSRQDELRITRLGADPERVEVTGNLKFDLPAPGFDAAEIEQFRQELKLPEKVMVWVAGSTRQGEEEIILDAYRKLLEKGQQLLLILVPRYPERAKDVVALAEKLEITTFLRSTLCSESQEMQSGEVVVGDTLGEMLKFYACADVVFVGGSLVPIGGHNVLEACLMKKPVLFGPHMENFRSISKLLIEAGGGFQVQADELADKVKELLADKQLQLQVGKNGYNLFAEHAGATERTVSIVQHLMDVDE